MVVLEVEFAVEVAACLEEGVCFEAVDDELDGVVDLERGIGLMLGVGWSRLMGDSEEVPVSSSLVCDMSVTMNP